MLHSGLQEDDIVEDVFQPGDVLTGLKMKHNVERNGVKWCDKPAGDIVVLSNLITQQQLVVETKNEQKFQFRQSEHTFPALTPSLLYHKDRVNGKKCPK